LKVKSFRTAIYNSKFSTVEISTLQQIVRDRYFKTDHARGIYHTALWFHEEVGELSAAIARGDRQNAKEELGDVLMWLLTLANLLDVDMAEVVAGYLNDPRKLPSK
jgi:NTP pyrophosphatase (non-canonical NTP hydrolase)